MKELYFDTKNGSIVYRKAQKEDFFSYLGPWKKAVFVEWMQAENQGVGEGSVLMNDFIAKMKNEGKSLIYLLATYAPEYYEQAQDPVVGLQRLVKFYESLGFECVSRPEFEEGFMIDMYLSLES